MQCRVVYGAPSASGVSCSNASLWDHIGREVEAYFSDPLNVSRLVTLVADMVAAATCPETPGATCVVAGLIGATSFSYTYVNMAGDLRAGRLSRHDFYCSGAGDVASTLTPGVPPKVGIFVSRQLCRVIG